MSDSHFIRFLCCLPPLPPSAKELSVIGQQYPFEMPVFKPLRLTFPEGIKMLQESGYPDVDPLGDLNTAAERHLGGLVKAKYGTDFYILHR